MITIICFEIDDPVIKSYNFLEHAGTLFDLLISLLNENETILDSSAIQLDLTKIIYPLKIIISRKIENITGKNKKKIFAAQNSFLIIKFGELIRKRGAIIDQFTKKT